MMKRWLVAAVFCAATSACASESRWAGFDVLKAPAPPAPRRVGRVEITPEDYLTLLRWGEFWFRNETFGGERATTDVAGLFQGELEVPCSAELPPGAAVPAVAPTSPACRRKVSVLPFLVQALDRLDGVPGNLFDGNGGALGPGYTSDLVLEFPQGTTLAGLPVPERLHTGLDVDAGSPLPIGVTLVEARPDEHALPYLVEPAALGAGPAAPGKYRLGITCALCHYSLDIDKDGFPDVRSSRWGEDTAESPWKARHTWGIGNQDVHFGWLFALTKNPLLGFTVLSGPVGKNSPRDAVTWVRWVKENYRRAPESVLREVIRGMLVQPRGLADDTPNALHDANQLPVLFTNQNWPYNFDGSFIDASDRNNGVWTGAIDFTGLISLASDRSGQPQAGLYWEQPSVYSLLTADEYADLMVDRSPAAAYSPTLREALKQDILGYSDGIPGLLDPQNVVLMPNMVGAVPKAVLDHPDNRRFRRLRTLADYGGTAQKRGGMMVLLGTRVITSVKARHQIDLADWLRRYPGLNADDFQSDAVSLLLDWLAPPPNQSALLANASALIRRGYEVFRDSGCATCHAGPFFTDNRMNRLFDRRGPEIGIAPPSTAGFRALGRGKGPAIGTAPYRTLANRALQLYVAPPYDPETGDPSAPGGAFAGFLGSRPLGYKTLTLRYVWGSAPYLHDGGVAVGLRPGAAPSGDDLKALLSRPATDKLYGMASLLAERERAQSGGPWPNAALSLQALLLATERERVIRNNRSPIMPVPIGNADNPLGAPATTSADLLGVQGIGHEHYVDDVPGGDRITSLVAFLLSLDDAPAELPSAATAPASRKGNQ
jgi:mono/diheme cytochrome c family protein